MNKVWFGSDLHLGHENVLRYTQRGKLFSDIREHDLSLTSTFNATVGPTDDVYLVGDVAMYKSKWACAEAIDKLNGRKHLVIGNHDEDLVEFYRSTGLFAEVESLLTLKFNRKHVVMCHYPIAYWKLADKTGWMLHGHFHGEYPYADYNLDKYRIMDVGYDALVDLRMSDWDGSPPEELRPGLYRPIDFDTIVEYFDKTGKVSMPKRHANHTEDM